MVHLSSISTQSGIKSVGTHNTTDTEQAFDTAIILYHFKANPLADGFTFFLQKLESQLYNNKKVSIIYKKTFRNLTKILKMVHTYKRTTLIYDSLYTPRPLYVLVDF